MADQQVNWQGASGSTYTYWVADAGRGFKDEPGNYIFAKETSQGRWTALYIGQTGSLRDRLTSSHEKWSCAKSNGATHIHTHTNSSGEEARLNEEADLYVSQSPPCND